MVHGARGLDESARRAAARFEREGFATLAPDLLAGAAVPGSGLADRRAVADLEAAAATLAQRPDVDARRLAVVGFGPGGTLAFLLGCQSRRIGAVVDFYGPIVYDELSADRPVQPLEMALNLSAPLLAIFGEADGSIPLDHVRKMGEVLSQFAKPHEILTLPGAGHGFADVQRDTYDPDASERAWSATTTFLREYLA